MSVTTTSVLQQINRRLTYIEQNMVTKTEAKSFVTKNDAKNFTTRDDLKPFATKDDLKPFATKDDLKPFATKDNLANGLGKLERSLKRRMGQHKSQIMTSVSRLAITTPTRKEFNALKDRFDQYYPIN